MKDGSHAKGHSPVFLRLIRFIRGIRDEESAFIGGSYVFSFVTIRAISWLRICVLLRDLGDLCG